MSDTEPSEGMKLLAPLNHKSDHRELYHTQHIISGSKETMILGNKDGYEYAVNNGLFPSFFDLEFDEDDEKHINDPLEDGKIEAHGGQYSLHRVISSPPPTSLQQSGPSSLPNKDGNALQYERVLSRFFEVGRLIYREKGEKLWSDTEFFVIKNLGPQDRAGLWILGDNHRDENEPEDSDKYNLPYSESTMTEFREGRVYTLQGFPDPIAFAHIQGDGLQKEFALLDADASQFVISSRIWLVG